MTNKIFFGLIFCIFSCSQFVSAQTFNKGVSECTGERLTKVPYVVPFQLFMDQILIKLTINDSPDTLNFLFDTGAEEMLIDKTIAEKHSFTPLVDGLTISAHGKSIIKRGCMDKVSVGGVILRKCNFSFSDLKQTGYGDKIDGIIGAEVLKHYVAEINNDRSVFLFYNDVEEIGSLPTTSIKFGFDNNLTIPQINTSFTMKNGKTYSGRFLMDTGANIGIMLNARFIEQNDLLSQTERKMQMAVSDLTHEASLYLSTIGSLVLAESVLDDIPTFFPLEKTGANGLEGYAGIIGNGLLSRFNITFDYKHQNMYLTKSKAFSLPFFYPSSGIFLNYKDGKLIAATVVSESEAYSLGMRSGDEILGVNDVSGVQSASKIQNILNRQTEGEVVRIRFRNALGDKEISIQLKRLI